MNQTNNWEEVDKRFDNEFTCYEIETDLSCGYAREISTGSYVDGTPEQHKEFIHQELTNLLKTVAEARPDKFENIKGGDDMSQNFIDVTTKIWNKAIDQWESNISEKYPEFKQLVKGK